MATWIIGLALCFLLALQLAFEFLDALLVGTGLSTISLALLEAGLLAGQTVPAPHSHPDRIETLAAVILAQFDIGERRGFDGRRQLDPGRPVFGPILVPRRSDPPALARLRQLYRVCLETPSCWASSTTVMLKNGSNFFSKTALRSGA